MENDMFLIPANSKKSMLILGFFTPVDLVIFGMGLLFTVFLLMFVSTNNILLMILILLPLLISAFLVLPIPYYHNMNQLIANVFNFFSKTRRYYWKGWGMTSENK